MYPLSYMYTYMYIVYTIYVLQIYNVSTSSHCEQFQNDVATCICVHVHVHVHL